MKRLRTFELPPALKRFRVFQGAMTLFAVGYTAMIALVLKKAVPYGLMMLYDWSIFGDFRFFAPRFIHFREPGFWTLPGAPLTYPAPLGVCLGLLLKVPRPVPFYLGICIAFWAAWHFYFAGRLQAQGISRGVTLLFAGSIALTTWPFWLLLDTANMEGVVAIVTGAALLAIVRDRWWLAAALIGVAGAMKIYPLVLLGLLLSKQKYREFGASLIAAAVVTVASLAILGPSIPEASRHVAEGTVYLFDHYVYAISPIGAAFDHSLFSTVKLGIIHIPSLAPLGARGHFTNATPVQAAQEKKLLELPLRIYLILVGAGGIAAYFLRIRKLPLLNQMCALSVCAVLLPPMSMDYTLLNLTVPFGLLCIYAADRWRHRVEVKGLPACLMCFPFFFAVGQSYYPLPAPWIACQLRTAALVAMLIVAMRFRFDRSESVAAKRGEFAWV